MRILLVTQMLPYPLDSGGKIRCYYLLRHLAREHRVTLAALVRTPADQFLAAELAPLCEAVHTVPLRRGRLRDVGHLGRSLLRRQPFFVARDWSPELDRLLHDLQLEQPFDAVQAWPVTMAPYVFRLSGVRRVVDCVDVWTVLTRRMGQSMPLWLRPLARLESWRLARYEPAVARSSDACLTVSELDRSHFIAMGAPPDSVSVVPIGIETCVPPLPVMSRDPVILHLGWLGYPPNRDSLRWLLRDIFPLVRRQLPECTLHVVGGDPPPDVVERAHHTPGVVLAGRVPDLEPYLRSASVLAVPLRAGTGVRVKILEALTRGLPVVSTTLGFDGIDAIPGEHLLAADEPVTFAAALVRVLTDPPLSARLAVNGRQLARERYDWRRSGEALDAAYARAGLTSTPAATGDRMMVA